jgi:hypothetical protein
MQVRDFLIQLCFVGYSTFDLIFRQVKFIKEPFDLGFPLGPIFKGIEGFGDGIDDFVLGRHWLTPLYGA